MLGIDIAALLTSLLAIAAIGTLIWQIANANDRCWLCTLTLFSLPLSALTFHSVRIPLDRILTQSLDVHSSILMTCKLWYAPVTEEVAKLVPLLLAWPIFGRKIEKSNQVPAALALGLGFAVGEMWLVASFVRDDARIQQLPFYQFGGFFNERLATCIAHPGFTVLSLWGLQRRGGRIILGMLGAMTFHFLSNFPIFLMNFNFGGFGQPTWKAFVSVWLLACVVLSVILLGVMHSDWKRIFHLITAGKVRCAECGEIYRQPILGCNFGVWRYEPCGACRRWHWVSIKDIQ